MKKRDPHRESRFSLLTVLSRRGRNDDGADDACRGASAANRTLPIMRYGKRRRNGRVRITLRDVLNLFLGEKVLEGDGSSETETVLKRLYGPVDEERYREVVAICRHHVAGLPRFRGRIRGDVAELKVVLADILRDARSGDPVAIETDWDRLGTILKKAESTYGRRFHVRVVSDVRAGVPLRRSRRSVVRRLPLHSLN